MKRQQNIRKLSKNLFKNHVMSTPSSPLFSQSPVSSSSSSPFQSQVAVPSTSLSTPELEDMPIERLDCVPDTVHSSDSINPVVVEVEICLFNCITPLPQVPSPVFGWPIRGGSIQYCR